MLRFAWEWDFRAPPDALWPACSDSDRFNRDTGLPSLALKGDGPDRVLGFRKFGFLLRWTEEPFDWARPFRFGVVRRYRNGPLRAMRVAADLRALPGGGTRLRYETRLEPRHAWLAPLLAVLFPLLCKRRFGRVLRAYDAAALRSAPRAKLPARRSFAPAGRARLASRFRDLLTAGAAPDLAARLRLLLEEDDDTEVARLRPYALASRWNAPRREILELCLLAVRAGLLDFRWDLLCPSCRGAKSTARHLAEIAGPVHCDACNLDFRAAFDRSVEITFAPNPSIRAGETAEYCLGSPQRTPHVHCRQTVPPGKAVTVDLILDPGRYRLRCPALPGAWQIRAGGEGETHPHAEPSPAGWPEGESAWSLRPRLSLANPTGQPAVFVLERTAWADDAATAAEVTALQSFRDLFASEALRPGEEIAVGSLAFLFTDLRGSTRLYREAGDARAFGWVMEHFDILKSAVAGEGGAVVKTIGDAVMAVFPRPQAAVRAALEAHARLARARPSLVLKTGVHCGPCIAVNQNDRLDYFGSTLNLSARLVGFSEGGDLIVTRDVADDPETAAWLAERDGAWRVEEVRTPVRGFGPESFALARITPVIPVAASRGTA
jgi:class 3 adenylate cyclase